jgi:oligoendopeptidase F
MIFQKKTIHSQGSTYTPLSRLKEQEYGFEESKRIVIELFENFDKRFGDAARRIFDNEHVHVFPKKGKKGGAYCYTVSGSIDPYVLLNHSNRLRDVFTLAHELGHAIHSILAQDKPDMVQHATLPLAETASIFSELLLSDSLLKKAHDNDERISIITRMLDDNYASIL